MKSLLELLGLLRLSLLLLVVLDILIPAGWILLRYLSVIETTDAGWQVIPSLIAPVMAPILFVVILFDFVMSSVHAADNPGAQGARHRLLKRIQIAFIGLLLLYWVPFFMLM